MNRLSLTQGLNEAEIRLEARLRAEYAGGFMSATEKFEAQPKLDRPQNHHGESANLAVPGPEYTPQVIPTDRVNAYQAQLQQRELETRSLRDPCLNLERETDRLTESKEAGAELVRMKEEKLEQDRMKLDEQRAIVVKESEALVREFSAQRLQQRELSVKQEPLERETLEKYARTTQELLKSRPARTGSTSPAPVWAPGPSKASIAVYLEETHAGGLSLKNESAACPSANAEFRSKESLAAVLARFWLDFQPKQPVMKERLSHEEEGPRFPTMTTEVAE
ncbi:hypothetical protein DAPPUDRAFT_345187 [Daphnia pulex]|uniref:Uncharacterized protein n=1 Tax=Daphnia pulex TaxID=6669 RepID=E9I789_DAPPU|nr:hypothetical protein DAPPUDRAFT_345187 [Daphnia pulex]|eukprot:EFX60141.1 hypothetical protein DAPPUDRAFT_345187 [Daphnia pulex]